ncbi:hypothetical protein TIFTF001_004042 [Ficus carica]|uniref:F-box domain-containing protein n=1 Tax=Ficus carica TaxID=3494 RepID=A0AA88A2V9_FICCA|nr:hypothetical protein TIFTF001_004042 [Ficus carica]
MLDGRENGEELECGATDRISKLPDLIIHHILSFLPTMELLSLKEIDGLNDRSFEDLVLANCPPLETLVSKRCDHLSTPQLSSSTLKSFEVELASPQTMKIEAINLQSLDVWSSRIIKLAACASLKRLSLSCIQFKDRTFARELYSV